jgi:RNA polymerase sigma factor for flagellar operon FliA
MGVLPLMNDELFKQYSISKDVATRNKLIENNLSLVKYVVSRVYSSGYAEHEYGDLVSYGVFGLITAIEKYDLKRKMKFSTYAYQKIYFSIIDELRKIDMVPRSVRYKIRLVKEDVKKLENKYGYEVNINDVAKQYNLSSSDIHVLDGTYLSPLDTVVEYIYDKRSIPYDHVLCGCTFRA